MRTTKRSYRNCKRLSLRNHLCYIGLWLASDWSGLFWASFSVAFIVMCFTTCPCPITDSTEIINMTTSTTVPSTTSCYFNSSPSYYCWTDNFVHWEAIYIRLWKRNNKHWLVKHLCRWQKEGGFPSSNLFDSVNDARPYEKNEENQNFFSIFKRRKKQSLMWTLILIQPANRPSRIGLLFLLDI